MSNVVVINSTLVLACLTTLTDVRGKAHDNEFTLTFIHIFSFDLFDYSNIKCSDHCKVGEYNNPSTVYSTQNYSLNIQ